ncbi:MAG TPA: 30S ribosomal protein S8 [Thermoplasmata archaeon]|nr:30S ribosomal protein S8 [Thermoplasmata archaeon]
MRHDLLNDALVTLGHADRDGKATVTLAPTSRLVGEVLRIFQEQQYIQEFTFVPNGRGGRYEVTLGRRINACGVIKPRLSVHRRELEREEARFLPAQDFGVLVLSTSQGVMSHALARERNIGGRLLAYVY